MYSSSKQKRLGVLTPSWAYQAMLFLAWTRFTLMGYVIAVFKSLPIIGAMGGYVYPLTMGFLLLIAWPWYRERILTTDLLFYLCMLVVALGTMIIPWDNAVYVKQQMNRIFLVAMPLLFIGLAYQHNRDENVLFWASLLSVVVMFAYQLYQLGRGRELESYDMDSAYNILPSVMVILHRAIRRSKLKYWLIAVFAIYFLFSYGTRGPILCMFLFCGVAIMRRIGKTKNAFNKIFAFFVIIAASFCVMFTDVLKNLAEELTKLFAQWGVSTRIFEFFIEGNITDDNGRNYLMATVWDALMKTPLLGLGFMGDRAVLGNYVHNIFMEILSNFGLLLGPALIMVVVGIPLRAMRSSKRNVDLWMFIAMLTIMNFVKLWLSLSYLQEPNFFFMMGVCLTTYRQAKRVFPEGERMRSE